MFSCASTDTGLCSGYQTPEQFSRFLPDQSVRALRILGIALEAVYE